MRLQMKKIASTVLTAILAVSIGMGTSANAAAKIDMSMIPKEDRDNYWCANGVGVDYIGEGPTFYTPGGITRIGYIGCGTEYGYDSSKIVKAVFSDEIRSISGWAFSETSIKTAYIPYLKEVDGNPFDCSKLEKLTIADDNEYLCIEGKNIYSKDKKTVYALQADKDGLVVIPEGVEKINYRAISSDAVKIVFPKFLTAIDYGAFAGCTKIKSITFPDWITSIDDAAFLDCTGLTKINLNKVTKIGNRAFSGCAGLKTITFNEGLKEIEDMAFDRCSLESITFSNTITEIGAYAFANNNISSPTFPKNMQVLKDGIYDGNPITTVILEDGIKEIASDAFDGIANLQNVVLPKTLTKFEPYLDNKVNIYLNTDATVNGVKKAYEAGMTTLPKKFITDEKELKALKTTAQMKPTVVKPVVSSTSVQAAWSKVEGASGYNVYIVHGEDGFLGENRRVLKIQKKGIDSTSITVKELEFKCTNGLWANEKYDLKKDKISVDIYVVPYKSINGKIYEGQYGMETVQNGAQKLEIASVTAKGTTVTVEPAYFRGQELPLHREWFSGYQVFTSTTKNGKYEKVATSYNNGKISFKLPKGTHYVKIRRFDKSGYHKIYTWFAPYSAVKTVTVK